jgi:hypothetical protein
MSDATMTTARCANTGSMLVWARARQGHWWWRCGQCDQSESIRTGYSGVAETALKWHYKLEHGLEPEFAWREDYHDEGET